MSEEPGFYVLLRDEIIGPFKYASLIRLAEKGSITPDTFIRQGKDGSWLESSRIKGLSKNINLKQKANSAQQSQQSTSKIISDLDSGVRLFACYIFAVLSSGSCFLAGFHMLSIRTATDTIIVEIAHGIGLYFIGKGFFVGPMLALAAYARKLRELSLRK